MTETPIDLAKRLMVENNRLRAMVAQRKAILAETERVTGAHVAAWSDRIDFLWHPSRLAGIVDLRRRVPLDKQSEIDRHYSQLIERIAEGIPGTTIRPLKIDYHALAVPARPYLVPPFIGIADCMLDLVASNPSTGLLRYVQTCRPVDMTAWRAALPNISGWLGGTYETTAHTVSTVTLERRTPLPSLIPYTTTMLAPGSLFLGIDVAARRLLHVPFADLSHMLVTGSTGMGKSVALDTILRSCLVSPSVAKVYAVDPSGVAFGRYAGTHAKLVTLSDPGALSELSTTLVTHVKTMEALLARTRRSKIETGFVILIIDEFPAYATSDNPDKKSDAYKAHQLFIANAMALGRRARKAGIRLIFVVQEPTERDISSGLRSVLPGVLAFRTPLLAHATALFGELTDLPADPRTLPRGRALYRDGTSGQITYVQFPVMAQGPSR